MEKLVIRNSRLKYVLLLIISIGFVAAGIWMISDGNAFGWICTFFFGSGIPLFVWQIIDLLGLLKIDGHGVEY